MARVLTAKWIAKAGEEERVAELLQELAVASRDEAGCRFYQPCRDQENARSFLIFEIYDDEAALEAHASSEHFQRLAAGEAFSRLESRERTFYETI